MKVIKAFPDINPIWLLTGHESMIKGEKAPNEQISTLAPVLAEDVINYENGIPYYNVDFTNGFMGVVEFQNIKPDYYINYPPANNCDFWINATGHSMENIINHGDIVAVKEVDYTWFPLGEIYAIVTSNGYRLIKRITKSRDSKCYRLVSENPDKEKYPDQDIPKSYITRLFKVVITTKIIN
ncbi:S24 family peptidase [Capnocytophaga leadbetteri]